MIGVRVSDSLKASFENVAQDLDSTTSNLAHTLFTEFLKEYAKIQGKGRICWPIRFHLAYHPQPAVRFGDEEVKDLPSVAEDRGGAGKETGGEAEKPAGGMKYPKPKRKRSKPEEWS